ncbi:uncharacterized protein LOC125178237 [Hyalella azteca]|uniref:Uncharacterized protein LOC125178237 n=1 Tax=Hyalella azteca TaxID=294128 RepID=A0A979FKD5_HYAAZ|nr:uncharacterized protein LOC125178237 [Hyalella azteca]
MPLPVREGAQLQELLDQAESGSVQRAWMFLDSRCSPVAFAFAAARRLLQERLSCVLQEVQQLQQLLPPLQQLYDADPADVSSVQYDLLACLCLFGQAAQPAANGELSRHVVRASWDIVRVCMTLLGADILPATVDQDHPAGEETAASTAMIICLDWITCYTTVSLATEVPVACRYSSGTSCGSCRYSFGTPTGTCPTPDRFRQTVEESEQRYQSVLVGSLKEVREATEGVLLLKECKPLLTRQALVPVFCTMIEQVLEMMEQDLDRVERQYVSRVLGEHGDKFSPSDLALWCVNAKSELHAKLQVVLEAGGLPHSPRVDACQRCWARTSALLSGAVQLLHAAWTTRVVSSAPTGRLDQPVLRWITRDNKHFLAPNFDPDVARCLQEARVWRSLGQRLPDAVACLDETALQLARKQVEDAAEHFNAIMSRVSQDEIWLFDYSIQLVVAALFVPLTSLTWNHRSGIPKALRLSSTAVTQFSDLLEEYIRFNEKFYQRVAEIRTMLLYKKEDELLLTDDEFIKDFLKQINAMITHVRNIAGEVENDLHALYAKIINDDATQRSKASWSAYVQKVDDMFLAGQKEMLKNTMIYLEKMLVPSESFGRPDAPLFNLRIKLIKGKITTCPLIDNLWQTITHATKSSITEDDFKLKVQLSEYKKQLSVKAEELKFKFDGVEETLKQEFPRTMQKDHKKALDLCLTLDKFVELAVSGLQPLEVGQANKWGKLLDQNALFNSLTAVGRNLFFFWFVCSSYLQVQVSGPHRVALCFALALWYQVHLECVNLSQIKVFSTERTSSGVISPLLWLGDEKWSKILHLEKLTEFKSLAANIHTNPSAWFHWYTSDYAETRPMPDPFDKKLVAFSKLLVLAKLRPDRLLEAAENFSFKIFKANSSVTTDTIQRAVLNCQKSTAIYLSLPNDLELRSYFRQLFTLCYPLAELTNSSILIHHLAAERLRLITDNIRSASCKGQWVILWCERYSDLEIEQILSILGEAEISRSHKRFQTWFASSDHDIARGEVLSKLLRFSISKAESIRGCVVEHFSLLGDGKLAMYTTDESKWYLLAQTLCHLSMKARQEFEEENFLQNIADAHWWEAEAIVRSLVTTENMVLPSSLIEKLEQVYAPTVVTPMMKIVIQRLLETFFVDASRIPERIPSFTHYSVPTGFTLDFHKSNLEFIYKATTDVLSFCSAKAINEVQNQEAEILLNTVQDLFGIISSDTCKHDEFRRDIVNIITTLDKQRLSATNPMFDVLLQELTNYKRRARIILQALELRSSTKDILKLINELLHRSSSERDKMKGNLNNILYKRLNQFKESGHYLDGLALTRVPLTRLDLRHFSNPLPAFSRLIQNVYPDLLAREKDAHFIMDLIYVPQEFRTDDVTPPNCIALDNMCILNATLDVQEEVLTFPDKASVLKSSEVTSLFVAPRISEVGININTKSDSWCEIPVYLTDSLASDPALYLLMPSSISTKLLTLHRVRVCIR